jgi:hypothetical protein
MQFELTNFANCAKDLNTSSLSQGFVNARLPTLTSAPEED